MFPLGHHCAVQLFFPGVGDLCAPDTIVSRTRTTAGLVGTGDWYGTLLLLFCLYLWI
jgi:hypothetical protein